MMLIIKPLKVIKLKIPKNAPIITDAIDNLLDKIESFFDFFKAIIPKIKPTIGNNGIKNSKLKINAVMDNF